MNLSRSSLLALLLAGGLGLPATVHADAVKHDVYILGIHLGNADGVLFGLTNSYDTSKKAHPKALPLLKRQWTWSIDMAKKLGLPSDGLEALDKDMDKLEFREMRTRLQAILTRYRSLLSTKIDPKAANIFDLSLDFTMTGGILTLARNVRPGEEKGWRDKAAQRSESLAPNIRNNKLEATVSLATDYTKRIRAGESFADLEKFSDTVLKKWQDDFLKAPGFAGSAGLAAALKDVQGTWRAQSWTSDGKSISEGSKDMLNIQVTIKGDKITIVGGQTNLGTFDLRIQAGRTPRTFEITDPKSTKKNDRLQGIYEVSGETLRACVSESGMPQPTTFSVPAGSKNAVLTFKLVRR